MEKASVRLSSSLAGAFLRSERPVMAKMPWMKYFPSDYLMDTLDLSLRARGAWSDLICFLWLSPTRGKLELTITQWAARLRCSQEEFIEVLSELKRGDICDVNWDLSRFCPPVCPDLVPIISRRMSRDETRRVRDAERKRNARDKKQLQRGEKKRPHDVREKSVESPREKLEARSQKPSSGEEKKKSERRTRMPENWSLSEAMQDYAKRKGMTPATVSHEFEHCKERHAQALFIDWAGVWRTWCLNWVSFGGRQVGAVGGQGLTLPKAHRALPSTPQIPHEPMPAALRELIGKAGNGKDITKIL